MAPPKKATNLDILRLNSVGLSLRDISDRLEIHHTTAASRLKEMHISPADTRRSFMGDIFDSLSESQQNWLIEQLIGGRPVKDFIKSLIVKEYISKNP